MSFYTTELRHICESLYDNQAHGYDDVEDVINATWQEIFSFQFPLFSEEYRSTLCKKIIKHFYTREIGYETYGLWKLKLDTKMNEIMPYYNKMYNSELLEIEPLYNIKFETNTTGSKQGSNTNAVETSTTGNATFEGNEHISGNENLADHLTIDRATEAHKETEDNSTTTGQTTTDETKNTSDTLTETGNKTENESITETDSKAENESVTETDNKTENNTNKYSDTPQGILAGIQSNQYLTNITIDDKTTSDNKSTTGEKTTTDNKTTTGEKTTSDSKTTIDTQEQNTQTATFNSETMNALITEEDNATDHDVHEGTTDKTYQSTFTKNDTAQNTGHITENTDGEYNGLETENRVTEGINGISMSALLKEFRTTFLNIDMMIIEELDELFIRLW